MSQTQENQPPRTRLWVRILLVISLMANLAIGGLVVGTLLGARERAPVRASSELLNYGPLLHAMPEQEREYLRQSLRKRAPELRATRKSLRNGMNDFRDVLRAEPFDREAAEAILARQQSYIDGQVKSLRADLLDRIDTMTAAERRALADRLEKALRRGPPRQRPQNAGN